MASFKSTIDETITCLESNLPTGWTQNRIQYPSEPFDVGNEENRIQVVTWDRTPNVSKDASGCYRISEVVMIIDVFTAKQKGVILAVKGSQHIENVFLQYLFNDVILLDSLVTLAPEDANWAGSRLLITYQYEEFINANYS